MDAALNIGRKRERAIYEYELPETTYNEDGSVKELGLAGQDEYIKKSIGMVKLEMSEEVAAAERAAGNQARLAYAWARFSLVEVDGRKLNKAEAEDETVLERTDPAIRELILTAYADMATAGDGVAKKFLGSRKIKAG